MIEIGSDRYSLVRNVAFIGPQISPLPRKASDHTKIGELRRFSSNQQWFVYNRRTGGDKMPVASGFPDHRDDWGHCSLRAALWSASGLVGCTLGSPAFPSHRL